MDFSTALPPNSKEEQSFLNISHLSTISVSNFVSSKLCGDGKTNNYYSWKEQMLGLIESQDLLEFILDDGKGHRKENIIRRTDRLVKGWILGALDDNLLKTAVNFTTAREVWLELENTFGDPGQLQLHQADGKEWHDHLPLYRATLKGDWYKAKEILEHDPNTMDAKLNSNLQTALHIAVGTGMTIDFVRQLVEFMPDNLLGLKDNLGCTALHVAALIGNTEAARILVGRRPDLLYEPNNAGEFPIQLSALAADRQTVRYFKSETKVDGLPNPYLGENGVKLLCNAIDSNIFDLALYLAETYPDLATEKLKDGNSALKRIALNVHAFSPVDIATLTSADTLISMAGYDSEHNTALDISDVEDSIHPGNRKHPLKSEATSLPRPRTSLKFSLFKNLGIRNIKSLRNIHEQAIKLVKCLCKNMESLDYCKASAIYEDAILTAARLGNHEIIEEIVATFPAAIYTRDIYTKQSIFHVAAENRQLRVFHHISHKGYLKHRISDMRDSSGNTFLHSAARLAAPQKLNLVIGAALQMQYEILWLKEIESFVPPHLREAANHAGKTARMVFTEEHSNLRAAGEMWEKDTANSCSIVAALIATITFAAAITVPGGIDSNRKGSPLFFHKSAFDAFTWFNIISFFTSITCLFLFLSTVTSRYTEKDFRKNVPMKLSMILLILFVSIISMMGAFIAAIYLLLLNDRNAIIAFSVLLIYAVMPAYMFWTEQESLTYAIDEMRRTARQIRHR